MNNTPGRSSQTTSSASGTPSPSEASASGTKYDLLAIDLDGTLLGHNDEVSDANIAALRAAQDAGLTIAICTGRGMIECMHVLERIEQKDPVVVAGGAVVGCPVSRRTLHRFAIDHQLVSHATRHLVDRGHPVLILKDRSEVGYDYLVVVGEEEHELDPINYWWFERMNALVRFARSIDDDEHPEHTVRLGVCGRDRLLADLATDLQEAVQDRAKMHHFPAVISDEHARDGEDRTFHILEVFHPTAHKWSAISWLANERGIDQKRIAAIGDEINDLTMITSAALGVAMGNAVPTIREAADRQTLANHEDGVAHAITQILDGAW